jgi:hypothetical protein
MRKQIPDRDYTNPKHYFVQSGERFLSLARSRSAGVVELRQAKSDTGRGKKIRRDDERMFGSGISNVSPIPGYNRRAAKISSPLRPSSKHVPLDA